MNDNRLDVAQVGGWMIAEVDGAMVDCMAR